MVSANSSASSADVLADLGGDLGERRFHRHARLDADQQQVERVGKGAHDRCPGACAIRLETKRSGR